MPRICHIYKSRGRFGHRKREKTTPWKEQHENLSISSCVRQRHRVGSCLLCLAYHLKPYLAIISDSMSVQISCATFCRLRMHSRAFNLSHNSKERKLDRFPTVKGGFGRGKIKKWNMALGKASKIVTVDSEWLNSTDFGSVVGLLLEAYWRRIVNSGGAIGRLIFVRLCFAVLAVRRTVVKRESTIK